MKAINRRRAMFRGIGRSIVRSPLKSVLMAGLALASVCALGLLRQAITKGEAEIEQLYLSTVVLGEIRKSDSNAVAESGGHSMNDVIFARSVNALLSSGFVGEAYLEAGFFWAFAVPADAGGTAPLWERTDYNYQNITPLFAVADLDAFLVQNTDEQLSVFWGLMLFDEDGTAVVPERIPATIEYAAGFDQSDFSYGTGTAIPAIIPAHIATERGIGPGDGFFIVHEFNNSTPWSYPAVAIGIYEGYILRESAYGALIIPMDALDMMMGRAPEFRTGYITVRFEMDAARNRETEAFRELLEGIVSRPSAGAVELAYDLFDGDLRLAVRQMEQNLSLLKLLYPVAITVSLLIAAGLCLLFQFQNAREAAVMRVLGTAKHTVCLMLTMAQVAVLMTGLLLGICVEGLLGGGFVAEGTLYALSYLAAALAGSLVGAVLVSNKPPLALLQVAE